jgi:DNA-binding transcriptional ArsR family regulator
MSRPTSSESVFRAVAHPTRRLVLSELRRGERPVNELLTRPGLTRPTLSIHLRILRDAGLVVFRRRGTSLHYRLNTAALSPLVKWSTQFRDR